MAVDAANLMSQVYNYFKDLCPSSTPDAFLVFERLGIPLNQADLQFNGTDCPPMAVEWVSTLANKVLVLHDGTVLHSTQTVDGLIGLLLNASRPLSADDAQTLGASKLDGASRFTITLQSLSGIPNDVFRPVLASPVDWFRSGPGAAAWSTYNAGQSSHTSTSVTTSTNDPPTLDPGHPRFRPLAWQTAPETDVASVTAPSSPDDLPLDPRLKQLNTLKVSPAFAPAPPSAAAVILPQMQQVNAALADAVLGPQLTALSRQRLARLQATLVSDANLVAMTSEQAVSDTSLSLSFEYCVVQLSWPWMPQTFLQTRNWYVPGYPAEAISGGSGAEDPGLMPVLPSAFLAIRNLTVTAQWSAEDLRSVQSAVALGPFSLRSSRFQQTTGTLTIPGLQIVGWFCSALPRLPPSGDLNDAIGKSAVAASSFAASANA